MSAIDDLFTRLRSNSEKAFMPFVTAGDPDLALSIELIKELQRRGCHLCEVGVPYSDPIADGPVIQASYTRALDRGFRLGPMFEAFSELATDVSMPRVCMVSYAIVDRLGRESFVETALKCGFAGAIVPDLPMDEARQFRQVCEAADLSLIQLIAPTTPDDRARQIAESTSGFIYYVSVTGITGERRDLPPELIDRIGWLREQTELPICIGFGISRPEHAQQLGPVADGLIVGSAIVKRIAAHVEQPSFDRQALLAEIGEFASSMLAVLNAPS